MNSDRTNRFEKHFFTRTCMEILVDSMHPPWPPYEDPRASGHLECLN